MRRTRRLARGRKTKGTKRRSRCVSSKRRGGTISRPTARGSPKSASRKGPVLGLPRRIRARNQRPTKPRINTNPVRPSDLRPLSQHSPPAPKEPSPSAVPLVPLPSLSASPESPLDLSKKLKHNKGKLLVRRLHSRLTESDKRKADALNKTHGLKKLLGIN
jgi:hypothetical protein